MTPEFALVQALRTVPVIADPDGGPAKVAALQPKKSWKAPFVFYTPTADREEACLDGPSGLQSFETAVHCVSGTYRGMLLLCARVRKALEEMPGQVYRTPADDNEPGGLRGSVLIEEVYIEQSSPDLLEADVGLYRRMYNVRIHYQTEEIYEEVISG